MDSSWQDEFERVQTPEFIGPVFVALLCTGFALFTDDQWVPILDSANLAMHEAGHPLFGIFGSTLGLYGGTLMQLVFPLGTVIAFWRTRQAHGVAVGGVWIGENLLNIGRYMADARAQMLPLAGGGEHDWTHIFTRWGVLQHDMTIGGATRVLGSLVIAGSILWLYRLWKAPAPSLDGAPRVGLN